MSEEQLIQSFVPTVLAEEITKRYTSGTASLVQFINHYSQRVQLQDALVAAMEKTIAGGSSKFASVKTSSGSHGGGGTGLVASLTSKRNNSNDELRDQAQALQKEVEAELRMHLHLGQRINNEVIGSLDNFMNKSAWLVAKEIEAKIRQMATTMRNHHELIPKLSARTVSKSAKTSQQAKQKLEEESRALVQLQLRWHKDIAQMVSNFESADVARVELLKESIFHFEHYRSEFSKATLETVSTSRQAAKDIRAYVRIIDVLRNDMQDADANAVPSTDAAPDVSTQASAKNSTVSASHRPLERGESMESATEGDGDKKGFFKRGIFRSKTKRVSKNSSPNRSITSSMHSRSISSNMASSSGLASGAPPSIQTALTKDTRESEGFSPGFSSDGASHSIPTMMRQRGNSFMSSHSSRAAESVQDNSQAQQQQQHKQPSASNSQVNNGSSQSSGGTDFAEWVFAEGSQEAVPAAMDASVGSIVHVAGAAGHLPPISEDADKRDDDGDGDENSTQDKQVKKADVPVASVSSGSGHIFGDIDNVRFEDVFGPSSGAVELPDGKQRAVTADNAKPSIDLDSVFSVPAQAEKPGATDISKSSAQKTSQFGFSDAFPAHLLNTSPGSHRRSLSLNGGSRNASSEGKKGESSGKPSDSDDDDDDGAEQSFRVKFSIRDQAIKDNPDESKAALSRVTTLLRAAPSSSRGRRRDVRTMYVPSSLPITSALGVGSDIRPGTPLSPQTPMPAGSQSSQRMLSSSEGSLLDEAFSTPKSPLTPMPQPNLNQEAKGVEPLGASANDDDDVVLAKVASASQSLNPSISEIAVEKEVVDVPVATITGLDVQAAVDESSSSLDNTVAVANASNEGVTAEPVDDSAEAPEAAVADAVAAVEETVNDSVERASESASVPEPPVAAVESTNDVSAQQKNDSSVRRRARPPPPPPGPPGARARSLRQQSQASLATVDAAVAEASQMVPQIVAEQDSEVRAVPRGRRLASSSGPLPISMHVHETLDFSFVQSYSTETPSLNHMVTGEIRMHIGSAINPLELAPLRISVQRPTQDQVKLVANPGVVIPDASLTSSIADGREWFRFVRPNLFSQVETTGLDVAVFKYQAQGNEDKRVMPMEIHSGSTCSAGNCGLMLFCEPNARGYFAGDTIVAPAVLLSIDGQITSQSSRPAAIWYRERNSMLWQLDDMTVPLAGGTDKETENAVLAVSKALALKAKGDGYPIPGSIALKFETRNTQIIDVPVTIGRVSAGSSTPVTVIDGPSSHVVKSGKCTYLYINPPREQIAEQQQKQEVSEQQEVEQQGATKTDDNEIESQSSDGRSRGSSMTSEAWSSAEEQGSESSVKILETSEHPAAGEEDDALAHGS
ncbi:hypothetical protein H4R99_000046 [Coemansia sp. RSA 1722]|nr:hypothetical protein IWW45_000072 [Coemansia sp. RSA 485]KAJ2606873.1 hypothetical protein H4R99_000046 [Coemansia sp. RSA 1722]